MKLSDWKGEPLALRGYRQVHVCLAGTQFSTVTRYMSDAAYDKLLSALSESPVVEVKRPSDGATHVVVSAQVTLIYAEPIMVGLYDWDNPKAYAEHTLKALRPEDIEGRESFTPRSTGDTE